jgi:hypothetical protein
MDELFKGSGYQQNDECKLSKYGAIICASKCGVDGCMM